MFVVLAGAGTLRLGAERHAVRTGHVIARPAGTGVAHQFIAGEDGLTLLAWGTRDDDHGTTVWALVAAPPLRLHGLPDYGELENTG